MKNEEPKKAFITVIGDDMGGALVECSNCHYDLHQYTKGYSEKYSTPQMVGLLDHIRFGKELTDKVQNIPPMQCPNCESYLTYGSITSYPFGGSDF